ncbi:tetratricopeptide repeat protein [Patescibacteria group bacterium]|nr:tetratricopeptide repeat protein [Patescibacteria group bacterium]MBU1673136.1 tetratricopeptide repeat protein [Patescibacteria group bacterium]MBU1963814.1 tetratricopeptide repeat protein [Patescibacteria group bacterium]
MWWIYLIFGAVIVGSLGLLAYYYINRRNKLAQLDLDAMKSHRQQKVKTQVVENRMARKYSQAITKIAPTFKKAAQPIKKIGGKLAGKISSLERKYKQEKNEAPKTMEQKEVVRQTVNQVLAEGQALMEKEDYAGAEKKYIEVLSEDSKNIEAYKKLADVYSARKDYTHAKETLEFIAGLNPKDEMIWRALGDVHNADEDKDNALKYYQKGLDLAPNNPKNIVLVIETSLDLSRKDIAIPAIDKLKEVNPDNQKLTEYLEKLENL